MNKKLLALAVAAALAPAAAMADSGNVTIYGQANASVDLVRPGTGAGLPNENVTRVSSNSSRIGFKGTEDVGNGLSAIWQMEFGTAIDDVNAGASAAAGAASNAGALTSRNAFVGLSSKTAGTVLLGKHDTPYKLGTASLDVFADTMGDYNAVVGQTMKTAATAGVNFDSRLGNVAAYISPTWSGFHFAAAYVAANETGDTTLNNGSAYSLTGVYANGPLFASLSYEKASESTTANSTQSGLPNLGTDNDVKGTKLGLGYNFGPGKVGLIWEKTGSSSAVALDFYERTAWYLNGQYNIGNNSIKAAYGRIGDYRSSSDTGARQVTIGVDHNLSKRSAVYALWTRMSNDTNAVFGLGGNGAGGAFSPAAAGQDPSAFSLGMKHSF